jgi:hypothetical protein
VTDIIHTEGRVPASTAEIKQFQGTIKEQTFDNECKITCTIPIRNEIHFKQHFKFQP